ncbi:DUF5753 domain-containing protein [Actinokineospora sp. NPDC004072]
MAETKAHPIPVSGWLHIHESLARDLLRGWPLPQPEELKILCTQLDREDWLPFMDTLLRACRHRLVKPPRPVGPLRIGLVTGLEAFADRLAVFDPLAVPAHLQTQMYAAALTKQDTVAYNVTREQRAALLRNDLDPLPFQWLTSEQAIRRRVGNGAVMDDQRMHLGEVARRAHVTIRVVPQGTGGVPTIPFQLIHGTPPVVVVPDNDGLHVSDDPETVASYWRMVHRVEALALSPDDSLALIRAVRE